jgi:hypothetical protein
MPFYLNGVFIDGAPQGACLCSSTVETVTTTDPLVLATVRPLGNVFEVKSIDPGGDYTYTGWVKLTFTFRSGANYQVTPVDAGGAASESNEICSGAIYSQRSAPFDVPHTEQCESETKCASCAYPIVTPDFAGLGGPVFDGWTQCAGYLDTAAGDELPATGWAAACKVDDYNSLRLVCGASLQAYRYIDASKNVFRDRVASYPENNLIVNAVDQYGYPFGFTSNTVYASSFYYSADVDGGYTSWWGTGSSCSEADPGLYIDTANGSCGAAAWEVNNCFGQNLTGDRYFWVYVQ